MRARSRLATHTSATCSTPHSNCPWEPAPRAGRYTPPHSLPVSQKARDSRSILSQRGTGLHPHKPCLSMRLMGRRSQHSHAATSQSCPWTGRQALVLTAGLIQHATWWALDGRHTGQSHSGGMSGQKVSRWQEAGVSFRGWDDA